jgi:hypothetical protein
LQQGTVQLLGRLSQSTPVARAMCGSFLFFFLALVMQMVHFHLFAGMTCPKPLAAICVTQALPPTPRFEDEAALSEEIWYTGL